MPLLTMRRAPLAEGRWGTSPTRVYVEVWTPATVDRGAAVPPRFRHAAGYCAAALVAQHAGARAVVSTELLGVFTAHHPIDDAHALRRVHFLAGGRS